MHGGLDNTDRDRLIDDFREGRSKVLITTNVLARGIDIASVSMVVNYDMPTDNMANQIHQLICIELVELVDLVELGYLFHLFMIEDHMTF